MGEEELSGRFHMERDESQKPITQKYNSVELFRIKQEGIWEIKQEKKPVKTNLGCTYAIAVCQDE